MQPVCSPVLDVSLSVHKAQCCGLFPFIPHGTAGKSYATIPCRPGLTKSPLNQMLIKDLQEW